MLAMKLAIQKPGWLRFWHIVYALFVLAALGGSPESLADDKHNDRIDRSASITAESQPDASHWIYTKTVRIELVKSRHLRLETTIPLDRAEESRLALGIARQLSQNWSLDLMLWTSL
jgi:hypothetical protein